MGVRQPLTRVQAFMLFSLGKAYEEFDARFAGRPVAFVMNKTDFIELVHKSHIATKKDRAVYRNLQSLEEQRYVSYHKKNLILTKKGAKEYERIRKETRPYLAVTDTLKSNEMLKFTSKAQTVLKK